MTNLPIPVELKQKDSGHLLIHWSDSSSRVYSVYDLRLECGCAHCKDEWSGKPILDAKAIPKEIYPKKIIPVGRYALQFFWSDGHETGIYSFDSLYRLGTPA